MQLWELKEDFFHKIGLLVAFALGIVLSVFYFKGKETKTEFSGSVVASETPKEMVMITRADEERPSTPFHPPAAAENQNIVNDDTKIHDNLEIMNYENSKDTRDEISGEHISMEEKDKNEEKIFIVVENKPEFPGGVLALRKYIASSIKYPPIALENGIQGRVFVNFVVDKDGSISNAKITRGVDPSIDNEALRVVMSLPKWEPGRQHGKAVRVSYSIPISFQLH